MANTSGGNEAASLLRIHNLSHSYGAEVVLREVSCAFPAGSLVAMLGPSGCGKTTLLKICAGLIAPSSGSVKIDGASPFDARRDGLIGYAFQSPTLLPWRTAHENIMLPLELLHKKTPPESAQYARTLLSLVGLEGKGDTLPGKLSGGMQQRVGLARALVTKPLALFLDEPFGQLDPKTRDKLNEKVREICQQQKISALFVTHSVTEAVFVADYVIILSSQPASIVEIIKIDLGQARSHDIRGTREFAKLVWEIDNILEQEHS